jgi:O-antigen/teichoic acid export membrane protein
MLLINVFMNPLAVGYYSISVAITEKLWLISQSASTVLFPKVSSEKDEKALEEFTPIVSRNVLLITALGAILIFFLSRWIVIFLFSEAYLPAVQPLQILLIGTVAVSGSRVLGNDIAGRGRPILNTYLNAITVVVNLCLDILWIPKFGITGAAWATTVSYSIALIGSLLVYSKISGNYIAKIIFIQKSDIALYRNFFSALVRRMMGTP